MAQIVLRGKAKAFSIGERAASLGFEFPVKGKTQNQRIDAFAGHMKKIQKQRLTGTIYQGHDDPNQTTIEGTRTVYQGTFDSQKLGFSDPNCSLKLTYDGNTKDIQTLMSFAHSDITLVIDNIEDIPETPKKTKATDETESMETWEGIVIDKLGLAKTKGEALAAAGIIQLGPLVKILNGEDPVIPDLTQVAKIGDAAAKTIRGKVKQYFTTQGLESPLNE